MRVEAVSIIFWRYFIEASKSQLNHPKCKKMVTAIHAVNFRPRMNPTLPDHAFGNLWRSTIAIPVSDGEKGYENLVAYLWNAVSNINWNYVKNCKVEMSIYILSRIQWN
ncbi:hypothetical protein ACH5RR_023141 [Cinchona calisaya]|uniref:Uncharacterized protein n=1 Tax=Cinchona calisaya TaxID=153742 RepID=A0ABD2Z9U1_9GENT